MIDVPVSDGVDEAYVLSLVERIRALFAKTSYGGMNPKFAQLRELYKLVEVRIEPASVAFLEAEIERLEGE